MERRYKALLVANDPKIANPSAVPDNDAEPESPHSDGDSETVAGSTHSTIGSDDKERSSSAKRRSLARTKSAAASGTSPSPRQPMSPHRTNGENRSLSAPMTSSAFDPLNDKEDEIQQDRPRSISIDALRAESHNLKNATLVDKEKLADFAANPKDFFAEEALISGEDDSDGPPSDLEGITLDKPPAPPEKP